MNNGGVFLGRTTKKKNSKYCVFWSIDVFCDDGDDGGHGHGGDVMRFAESGCGDALRSNCLILNETSFQNVYWNQT